MEKKYNPADFEIKFMKHGYSQHVYSVKKINKNAQWPNTDELLKICDDGWDAFFDREPPCHFGGQVEIDNNNDTAAVTVYID